MSRFLIALFLYSYSVVVFATIADVRSPTQYLVNTDSGNQILTISGQPIQFCKKSGFEEFSRKYLVGNQLANKNGHVHISVLGQWVPLDELLVRSGYVFDPKFWEALSVAAGERKGEWACASKEAVFRIVLKDRDFALVIGAIAQNESKYKGYPWPWTLNVHGKPYYFETRKQAHDFVLLLLKNGIQSFDVGLTQINWKYHSHRFKSPWDALNPVLNIQTSKEILTDLIKKTGNLERAIACYHNCVDKKLGQKYLDNFRREYEALVLAKGK